MERAGFISLLVGAVVIVAFTVRIDMESIDYITFMVGIAMVLAGLVMLYRCEVKRTKMLE
jgi:hypothetical protein